MPSHTARARGFCRVLVSTRQCLGTRPLMAHFYSSNLINPPGTCQQQ